MKEVVDMLGRKLLVPETPKRIISLVPSQTELLFSLGLQEEVVGITKFCEHPKAWFKNKPRVGGTKQVNLDKIEVLNPDLILANKEENTPDMVEELSKIAPVWVSDVRTLEQAVTMIFGVGNLVGCPFEAERMAVNIESSFEDLGNLVKRLGKEKKVLYLIWKAPYMAVSGDTFIGDMIRKMGWVNVLENSVSRYPSVTIDEMKALQPDLLLLSSEPFPFKLKHCIELSEFLSFNKDKIVLVDGSLFSWYGSRLLDTPKYLNNLLFNIY